MPTNTAASLQLTDPVLTEIARRYKPHGFIWNQLLPTISVSTLTGKYPVWSKADWFANDVDNRKADRAPSKEIDFSFDVETYACEEYALKVSLTDLERQQADNALRFEQSKTEFLALRHNLSREVRVATLLRKTDVAGGGLNLGSTPSVNWDQATATIEADIQTANLAIYDATGLSANTIVIPYKVAYAMATQEDIRAIVSYEIQGGNGASMLRLGSALLPPVIHGLRVVIPTGPQYTTSNEGAASPSYGEIWGDHVRILYVDPNASWGTPSVAYRFQHTGDTVKRWRSDDPDVDYIRLLERCDEKVVAADLGYELRSLLS